MSDLLFKLCPKCKRLMPVGNGSRLCQSCAERESKERVRKRDYAKEYRSRADDAEERRFYRSKSWRLLSRKYAQSVGYRCEDCGEIGTDVHHIIPIQTDEGWARRFDPSNFRLLCVSCHNKAHGRTFSNGWGGSDGWTRTGETEEDAGNQQAQLHESAEGGTEAGGGVPRVSDYRV